MPRMLYADRRAIGVVEAKPAGYPLQRPNTKCRTPVQTLPLYTDGLPEGIPNYRLPLPFAYESTGKITHFTNGLDPGQPTTGAETTSSASTFHRP